MRKKEKKKTNVKFKDFLAFAWTYWKRHPGLIGMALGLSIAARVIDIVYPVYAGKLVDALSTSVAGNAAVDEAVRIFLIFFSLHVGFQAFKVCSLYFWNLMAVQVLQRIIRDSTHRVQRFSTEWHASSFAGATVRKITRGKWAFDQFEDILFMGLFPAVLVLVGITCMQFARWPVMGAIFAVGFAIYGIVSVTMASRWVGPAMRRSASQDSKVGGALADMLTCNVVVKAFGSEDREDAKFGRATGRWRMLALRAWQRSVTTDLAQATTLLSLLVSVLGYAVWLWSKGLATPGDVNFVLVSYFIIGGYVRDIGMHIRNLQRAMGDLEDVVVFSKLPIGVADRTDAEVLDVDKGEIRFDNVTFTYGGQRKPVYENFSLDIKPGEKIGLVGHSGSGKSTFVKLIQRLYDVQGGKVMIDGQDIAQVSQESLRKAISLVPQEPVLFHRSLAENISYGNPEAGMDEIVAAAKKAHAHEFISRLPQGFGTQVGERGVKLSGGERQRVAIARAILADCPILILDEATSSLDSISEALIQDAIENLMEGRTTIVIAHRLSTIQNVDRILVFEKGRVVEQGSHAQLVNRENGHYRALFTMQAFGLINDFSPDKPIVSAVN